MHPEAQVALLATSCPADRAPSRHAPTPILRSWVLKPGVATISSMCLDVIARELKPLLEQSLLRGLTTHEATLLEGVKKAVEMLLEVAFENYYALGDDQPREGGDTPRGAAGAPAWRPTVLMVCGGGLRHFACLALAPIAAAQYGQTCVC